VITEGILGSLEYATAVAGSRLIVVLGHTRCGAIKGACDDVKMGNLTSLIDRIRPAITREHTVTEERHGDNPEFVNAVSMLNIKHSVEQIMEKSVVIKELVEQGKVGIVPAMYDVTTGRVTFFEDEAVVNIPERKKAAKVV
jgi:carbonic anhydrase